MKIKSSGGYVIETNINDLINEYSTSGYIFDKDIRWKPL